MIIKNIKSTKYHNNSTIDQKCPDHGNKDLNVARDQSVEKWCQMRGVKKYC